MCFIVRAVDEVLRCDFGLAEGLADTARTTVDAKVLNPEDSKLRMPWQPFLTNFQRRKMPYLVVETR